MRNRTDLSPVFKDILSSKYKRFKVYFQPPATQKIEYPCIIYQKDDFQTEFADNSIYRNHTRYTVTLIGNDPDNDDLIEQLLNLQYCSFNRRFISDNLYHDVFDLFY